MGGKVGPEPTALDAGASLPAPCISQELCFNNKSADLTDEGLPGSRWGSSCQDIPISRSLLARHLQSWSLYPGPTPQPPRKAQGHSWGLPLVADKP